MSVLKCDQTGHFFAYYPEHDLGFTCFQCLEEFGCSGRKPSNSDSSLLGGRGSRKRRSLHLSFLQGPPPAEQPTEPTVISERDESGRRRSKPWRCLQNKCKLLACESCSDWLIDPEYISAVRDRTLHDLHTKAASGHVAVADKAKAGAAIPPPEKRAFKELRSEAKTQSVVSEVAPSTGVDPVKHLDPDSDETGDEVALEELRSKLVYRRAGHITATSTLAQYHYRTPGRPPNRAGLQSKGLYELLEPSKFAPTLMPQELVPQEQSQGIKAPVLEVDSDDDGGEEEDDDADFIPQLKVRSATEAANQAMRSMHFRMRERVNLRM